MKIDTEKYEKINKTVNDYNNNDTEEFEHNIKLKIK